MKRIATWALVGALLGLLVFDICSLTVFAATFSWVYNNVEQGPNGVANPKIEVNGQSAKPAPVSADAVGSSASAPVIVTTPPAAASTQKVSDLVAEPKSDELKHWTLGTGLVLLRPSGSGIGSTLGNSDSTNFGGELNLGYRFSHDLGVSAFAGFYQKNPGNLSGVTQVQGGSNQFFYGGEAEFTPLHMGFLGNDHVIDLGAVGSLTSFTPSDGSWLSVNGGPLAVVNFSEQFAVMADYRFAAGYSMAEAKVALRF